MASVVTVTLNPSIDKSAETEHVRPEDKLRCTPPRREPGGGGINVAHAIRNLDGNATPYWSRGGDTGNILGRLIDDIGLDHVPVDVSGLTRENLIVYETASGNQYRFGMPGDELDRDDAMHWLNTIENLDPHPDYLIASGSLPPGLPDDFYAELVDRVPEKTRVIVDTSGDALCKALERGVYLVKPNLRELGDILRRELQTEQEILDAARSIIDKKWAEVVIVSLGRGGALLVTADQHDTIRAPIVRARSKVGAGDSMVGGTVYGLVQGWQLHKAVMYGIAAGSAAVMTAGTELCRREDTEHLFKQMGGQNA